MILSLQAERLV